MTEKVDTTTLAFTWAAFGAAEALLNSLARNSSKAQSHAELLLDFVNEGKLGLPPSHYIAQMAKQFAGLDYYQGSAIRLVAKIADESAAQAAE